MYLDWENAGPDVYCIDIEGDSLTPTVLWCMCWENLKTKEKGDCVGHDEIEKFFKDRPGACFVGHNILKFDAPVLNRMVGAGLRVSQLIDTLVLSTLYSPSLNGGHSLGAWGERIGYEKIDFHEFHRYSEEMLVYCRRDVQICAELFRRLMRVLSRIGFSEQAIYIQHNITVILERQHKNGFYFDGPRAIELYTRLRRIEEELQDEIRAVFPPEKVLRAERAMFTKGGSPTAVYSRDLSRYTLESNPDGRTYRAYEFVEFNVGSPKQRVEKLLALGWKPTEFTPRTAKGGGGTPKVTEKSLVEFADEVNIPEVALIAQWMSTNGRANMINTWLNEWNEDDGCIHGKLFVADTLRFRHQAPNTANIPAVRLDKQGVVLRGNAGHFTYEARDLWCARPGRVLVGTDAAGLELRMLAHYLNNPEFSRQVIEGDPHQFNADLVGITRPQAKTLIYAVLYGAAAPKIASTLKVPVREAARIRNLFLERLGVGELMEECQREQANGRVWLVDGAGVVCPSPHAALNYKLQGGGARVMALGSIILERSIRRDRLDSLKVGDIHDEWQYDVHNDSADLHAERSVEAIRQAGLELRLNVLLDGKAKKGLTWACTH